jgi:hypothetical protein
MGAPYIGPAPAPICPISPQFDRKYNGFTAFLLEGKRLIAPAFSGQGQADGGAIAEALA